MFVFNQGVLFILKFESAELLCDGGMQRNYEEDIRHIREIVAKLTTDRDFIYSIFFLLNFVIFKKWQRYLADRRLHLQLKLNVNLKHLLEQTLHA